MYRYMYMYVYNEGISPKTIRINTIAKAFWFHNWTSCQITITQRHTKKKNSGHLFVVNRFSITLCKESVFKILLPRQTPHIKLLAYFTWAMGLTVLNNPCKFNREYPSFYLSACGCCPDSWSLHTEPLAHRWAGPRFDRHPR